MKGQAYSYHPLYDIQANSQVKQGLIDHILVFENYPVEQELDVLNSKGDTKDLFHIHDFSMEDETNYSFYLMVAPGDEIHLKMRYDSSMYDRQFIENIKGHLAHIVSQVLDKPDITPDKLAIITPGEKRSLRRFLKRPKSLNMTRFMRCLNGRPQKRRIKSRFGMKASQ
ncbi:condensation domain-containing protein [Bacillus velezensis]|nr:condensation domain-containing protein [Bacillus velezensis]